MVEHVNSDTNFATNYIGNFDGISMLNGKVSVHILLFMITILFQGVLNLSRDERIEGSMYGNISMGEIKISNGIYYKNANISSSPVAQCLVAGFV